MGACSHWLSYSFHDNLEYLQEHSSFHRSISASKHSCLVSITLDGSARYDFSAVRLLVVCSKSEFSDQVVCPPNELETISIASHINGHSASGIQQILEYI